MNNRFENRSRHGNNDRQQFTPPVNVGDELIVRIESVGDKGDGVAKKNGFVLFVPGVKEDEHVKIKVTKVLRKVGFADLIEKVEAPAMEERAEEPKQVKEKDEFDVVYSEENDSEDFGDDLSEDSEETKE